MQVVATVTKLLSIQMLPPASVAWNENPNIGLWEPFPDFYQRYKNGAVRPSRLETVSCPFLMKLPVCAENGLHSWSQKRALLVNVLCVAGEGMRQNAPLWPTSARMLLMVSNLKKASRESEPIGLYLQYT